MNSLKCESRRMRVTCIVFWRPIVYPPRHVFLIVEPFGMKCFMLCNN